ncbi:hypothetical protein GCM10022243_30580 [Saccharothrix violaceirubra]|uniref:Uncharacterized protein n=1 Tax=Saccharothrix violaceirubra TaxID=413306 RepID=A0A7W7T4Z6_9PSEU|nr:hypothetical protein [Saccharothrix violaceirubra]MBB4966684.1 hypothetical protein [Saccharothrix violaceirubra]
MPYEEKGLRVFLVTAVAGYAGYLALAFLDAAHFWIATAIRTSFVLASVTAAAVKPAAYRKGL